MKRFIITNDNYLYDCNLYGSGGAMFFIDTMERSIEYNKKNNTYYIRHMNRKLEETKTPLDVIASFDDIEDVKEKYLIEEEPYKVPFASQKLGYIVPIRVFNIKKLNAIKDDVFLNFLIEEYCDCLTVRNAMKSTSDLLKSAYNGKKIEGQLETYAKCMIRYANIKYGKKKEEKKCF